MDVLEKLRKWLLTYPGWDAGGLTYIDFTDGMPGSTALYPQGMEELERAKDVTGRVCAHCRWNFVLYRIGQQAEAEADAAWLLAFAQWVQQQSATGLAPVFGDEPERERMYARKGRLQKANTAGTVSYSVELCAEFTKYYENREE